MNIRIIIFLSLTVCACSDYQSQNDDLPEYTQPIDTAFSPATLNELGAPVDQVDQVIEYSSFSVGFKYETKQAAWSGYMLQPELVRITNVREDSFKEELLIPSAYRATLNDYSGSGYQRGHLAPNATLDHTDFSMSQTFYLSNISPQTMSFNIFDWRELETFVRNCIKLYEDGDKIFVFTGPYFDGRLISIGDSNIPVPTGFYKVIYEFNDQSASAFAVMAPHDKFEYSNLAQNIRSIDFIEQLVGLDFAVNLPEELELELESKVSPVCELPSR